MFYKLPCFIILIIFANKCASDQCVTHNFENDIHLFNNRGLCDSISNTWALGNYFEIGIDSPNDFSTKFIAPSDSVSCGSSPAFEMEIGGVIEVTTYMRVEARTDQIQILIQRLDSEQASIIGYFSLGPTFEPYEDGWVTTRHTLKISFGSNTFLGYINFIGTASNESSVVLVDSFRYIPPNIDEDTCIQYSSPVNVTTPPHIQDDCITYDFEQSFDLLFNNEGSCSSFVPWVIGKYANTTITPLHENSKSFIEPRDIMGCTTTFTFPMSYEGTIEVTVYIDYAMSAVLLTADVLNKTESGDIVVGRLAHSIPVEGANGWYTMRGTLLGEGYYTGYILFTGFASSQDATMLIDSFRYIPPHDDELNCQVYKDIILEPEPTTTEPEIAKPECITYDFESDFDTLFKGCSNIDNWDYGFYSSISVQKPHQLSNRYITPSSESLNCVKTFTFPMQAGGIIEANVFLNRSITSIGGLDNLFIYAFDTANYISGYILNVTQVNPTYFDGRLTYSGVVQGNENFYGYISFYGSKNSDTILLIDSFRYIPPTINELECIIYNESYDVCFSNNFEDEDVVHDEVALCDGLDPWGFGFYSDYLIESPHPSSTTFLTPGRNFSCVASNHFPVSGGGMLEVIVYMDPKTQSDYIVILAHAVQDLGNDAVIGIYISTPTDANFVGGWNTVKIKLLGQSTYDCYVTLMGISSDNSTILVDSFRYIPPTSKEDECVIYEDVSTDLPIETDTTTKEFTTTDFTTVTMSTIFTDNTATATSSSPFETTPTFYPSSKSTDDNQSMERTSTYPTELTEYAPTTTESWTSKTESTPSTPTEFTFPPFTYLTTEENSDVTVSTTTVIYSTESTIDYTYTTEDNQGSTRTWYTESSIPPDWKTTEDPNISTDVAESDSPTLSTTYLPTTLDPNYVPTTPEDSTTTVEAVTETEGGYISTTLTTPEYSTATVEAATETEGGYVSTTLTIPEYSTATVEAATETEGGYVSTPLTTPEYSTATLETATETEEGFVSTTLTTPEYATATVEPATEIEGGYVSTTLTTFEYSTATVETVTETLKPISTTTTELTTSSSTIFTTENPGTTPAVTEDPIIESIDDEKWLLTILIVVLCVFIFVVFCVCYSCCCYYFGYWNSKIQQPNIAIPIVNNTGDRELKFWKTFYAHRDLHTNRQYNARGISETNA